MTTAPKADRLATAKVGRTLALSEVGQKIAALRKERQLTGLQLAELAQISPSHLSYIENGRRPADQAVYRQLAAALNVPAEDITFGDVA